MKYYLFIILVVFSVKLFSLDLVIYENPKIFHSKDTITQIEENKKNLIEFKDYKKECNIQCMLSESLYQSYLYYTEQKTNKLYLSVYEIKTGARILYLNQVLQAGTFKDLVIKANALIRLYNYKAIDIFQAIDQKNIKLLKFFIKKDFKNTNGLKMTPLNYALFTHNYDLVKYLLKEPSVMYDKDIDGIAPLHRIAQWGNLELFKKYYFDFLINFKSNDGKTFLHFALLSGNMKLIEFMLKKGFSLGDKTKLNKNSLHFAAESGNMELFNLLFEKNKKNLLEVTKNKRNILHFAAKSGNIELFLKISKLLKEENFDIKANQFDKFHRNYIFYSVLANKEGYINEFIKLKQKMELDFLKNTLLHYAVKNNKINSIRDLLKLGLNTKQENTNKVTPVLLGFRYLNLKELREILIDINFTEIKDKNGLNVLHYAILGNKFRTINFLFFNEVNINSKSKFGENALFFAILSKSKALFLYLYYRGVSSDIKFSNGDTLLHIASQERDPWFFNFLMNNNSNIYLQNKRKEYPLDIAIKEDNLSVIKSFNYKHKVEFYRPDLYNNRAIEKVIIWGYKDIFDYLLKEKVRVDIPNNNQECALDIAIKLKRTYMISQLKKIAAPICKK